MDIKKLNPHKEEFLEFLEFLPISSMEEDIKSSYDHLIKHLYGKLICCVDESRDSRYKKIYHDLGICSIYALIDPMYGDPVRWLLHEVKKSSFDIEAKPFRFWRVNNTNKTGR